MLNTTYTINDEKVVESRHHHDSTTASKPISRSDSMITNDWWNNVSDESFLKLERQCVVVDWAAQKWLAILRENRTFISDEQEPIDTSSAKKTLPVRLRPSVCNVFPARKRLNFFGSPILQSSVRYNDSNKENGDSLTEEFDLVSAHNESKSKPMQNQTVYEFDDTLDAVEYFIEQGSKLMTVNSPCNKNSNGLSLAKGYKYSENDSPAQRTLGRRQLNSFG